MFRLYADLTKFGIVIFVVLSGLAGYFLSFNLEQNFSWQHLTHFCIGIFFLSSGSLALNQVQELEMDKQMPRTAKRPLASGKLKLAAAVILSISFLVIGSDQLFKAAPLSAYLGWLVVILYNGFYTKIWKPRWVFAAIPGAIPGTLPVTMGYAANSPNIFSMESIYLFLILFLWQMPHFWALAIKYKDDYAKGSVPTLPVALGLERTLYHMGIWTFLYVFLAAAAPIILKMQWTFLVIVLPFCFFVMREFIRYYKVKGEKYFLPFFMWLNLSVLIFLFAPAIDKWIPFMNTFDGLF